jgi:hypothetical protein
MVQDAQHFIEAKGIAAVASATGRTEGAVRVWKTRNRLPREAWLELTVAFPEDLTLETLERIEQHAKPRPARSAA